MGKPRAKEALGGELSSPAGLKAKGSHLRFRVISVILGLYRDNGKENGTYSDLLGLYRGVLGGYIGIMEKKMETTIVGLGFWM